MGRIWDLPTYFSKSFILSSMSSTAITVGITAKVVTELLNVLAPYVTQNIKSLAWGFKDDMENLEEKFKYIQSVTNDSEDIQISKTMQIWLEDLRDIAYDAEDVLDDFLYQVTRNETVKGLKNKVRDSFTVSSNNPLLIRFKIARKIKAINKRLEVIFKNKEMFQFPNNCTRNTASTSTAQQGQSADYRRSRSSGELELEEATNFIGRDKDRLEIVKLLTSFSSQSEKLPVLPIVGMGGVGKTTLAQFVCKDKVVVKFIDLIIWIYVSENFDHDRIVKEIVNKVTEKNKKGDDGSSSWQGMERELRENLRGKKFLLVLDDLWSEDKDRWEMLKTALTVGADGSKIMVTTRKEQVVSMVRGTIDRYSLSQLTENQCWSIIMKKAFAAGGAKETPPMVAIGEQIAKKCGGLPLVARTLGSLMYTRNTISNWASIKENEVFKMKESESKIIFILKLSYDNLPSEIKRCFSYCCMFTKGFRIERTTLINLWIAEGFLQQSGEGNGNTMEYIGNEYFNHLVQNSLFQDIKNDHHGQIITFKLHDLMYDLAKMVLGDYEFSIWKTSEPEHISKVCRIQMVLDDNEISALFWKSLANAKKLRTVIAMQVKLPDMYSYRGYSRPDVHLEMFLANRNLRVLYVLFCSKVNKGLSSLSKLRHLRYLNLRAIENDIILENRAISVLYHLQTLVFRFSIKKLPEDIGLLKNLRHLDLRFNENLEALPQSITNLMSLQTLDLTFSGLKCLPEEIGELKHLKRLHLGYTKVQELPESITDCCYLAMLEVGGCELSVLPENIGRLKYLWCLNVAGTCIRNLPVSICDLENLTWLNLGNCDNLEKLPTAFGDLIKLRYLDFSGTRIIELPESCNYGFHSMESLTVSRDFEFSKEAKDWINLQHLRTEMEDIFVMTQKPLLRAKGIRNFTSLKTLETYCVGENRGNDDDGNGIGELRELNLLEGSLEIRDLQNVNGGAEEARRANLQLKQNISSLTLHWCERVIKVEEEVVNDEDSLSDEQIEAQEEAFTDEFFHADQVEVSSDEIASTVEFIEVEEEVVSDEDSWIDEYIEVEEDVVNDEEVLEGLEPHINLRELVVENFLGTKLPSWLMSLPYLVEIVLYNCYRCEQILGIGLLPCLKSLTLSALEQLEKWVEPSLTADSQEICFYPCLEELVIVSCPNLKVVQSSTFPSLKDLCVKRINPTGLCSLLQNNLTSLAAVTVGTIPGLKFLPVEMFQPSLKSLKIELCPERQGLVSHEEKHILHFSKMTSLREVSIKLSKKWKPFEDLQRLPNLEELELYCDSGKDESSSGASASSVMTPPLAVAADEEADLEGIQHLTSLRYLSIFEWSKPICLPRQLQYLTNLRGLWIGGFDRLEAFPEWLENFSSLEKLYITGCKNLMHLPSEDTIKRLTSLKELNVSDCLLVQQGCADKEGEEFQKISHIKHICGLGGRQDNTRWDLHEST